jgi:flagellar L-ring protein precursor FlgH
MRTPLLLSACLAAAGCVTIEDGASMAGEHARGLAKTVNRQVTGPHLSPMANPANIPGEAVTMPTPVVAEAPPSGPNSLWRAGGRTFFNDQRATAVGDILTVRIAIDDSAHVSNATNRNRTSTTEVGVTNLFGKQESLGRVLPPGGSFDPAALLNAEGASSAAGTGSINRAEKIELTLAGTITQLLANGNLVLAGRQEVRINGELRELLVTGVIRPQDIAPDNSVRHDQMAEARISYGGRGTISAVQKPRIGQRLADAVSPW